MENIYFKENGDNQKAENLLADYEYKTSFNFNVVKVKEISHKEEMETIIGEFPLSLVLNGEYSNTFLCTPENLEELVAGFLVNILIVPQGWLDLIIRGLVVTVVFLVSLLFLGINKMDRQYVMKYIKGRR